MTASAPRSLRPGRTAFAGRPVGALWFLLLVGLLAALPCAGQAQAVSVDRSAPASVPDGVAGPALAAAPTTGTPWTAGTPPTPGTPPTAGAPRTPAAEHASRQAGAPRTGPAGTLADRLAEQKRHRTWCSADGEPPHRDNGCSGHPYCAQDAQLPNPPPQQQPALTPRPETPGTRPRMLPRGLPDGPRPAPDLHELQVHRS
ncbi:hypothetical protein ACIF6L_08800 [Kitasatospora sp. NPDC086009]|uniref:hypothetical protein n=1 Tax=unclassified Kitasatospora TaxID=2633591 RepID=UPI0037C8C9CB